MNYFSEKTIQEKRLYLIHKRPNVPQRSKNLSFRGGHFQREGMSIAENHMKPGTVGGLWPRVLAI